MSLKCQKSLLRLMTFSASFRFCCFALRCSSGRRKRAIKDVKKQTGAILLVHKSAYCTIEVLKKLRSFIRAKNCHFMRHARLAPTTALFLLFLSTISTGNAFHPVSPLRVPSYKSLASLKMSTTATEDENTSKTPNYNGVHVAKTGGMGAVTASQQALERNLSLGAPGIRPTGGHYLTKGGIQVTAHVKDLEFSSDIKKKNTSAYAMEALVQQLDDHRGVVLTSSYEFPGRYARWSLGFVDPPLEISGRGQDLHICALNARGRLILPAIETAMKTLKEQGYIIKCHEQCFGRLGGNG